MRISDWSSDVCSSDLSLEARRSRSNSLRGGVVGTNVGCCARKAASKKLERVIVMLPPSRVGAGRRRRKDDRGCTSRPFREPQCPTAGHEIGRAHSELQSLMRISYAVFCLKKKTSTQH